MPMHIIQNSFAGGEWSPYVIGRVDIDKYATSCALLENMFSHPYGAASNRTGTLYSGKTKYGDKRSVPIPFIFNTNEAYVLEFGHEYIGFYNNQGDVQLQVNGQPYRIASPYKEEDVSAIKYCQSADTIFLFHAKYPPKKIVRYGETNWVLSDFPYAGGPFMTGNVGSTAIAAGSVTGTVTVTASADVFSANQVGSLLRLTHSVQSQNINQAVGIGGNVVGPLVCNGQWTLKTTGTWAGTLEVRQYVDESQEWRTIRTYSSAKDNNIIESGEVESASSIMVVASPITEGTVQVNLSIMPYVVDGIVKITSYSGPRSVTGVVQSRIGSIDPTTDWAEGSWSDKNGYPFTGIFFENRLFVGGTNAEPLTIWGSKPNDYPNFSKSLVLKENDAVSIPLVSRIVTPIRSLAALNDIIAMTSGAEWKISGGSNSAISATSILAKPQTYYGTAGLDPVMVGNRVLFVQEMGSRVRDMGYSWQSDTYSGDDLTVFARHLFEGHTIVSWAHQQEPENIIWAVRDDGVLLGFTFLKEHQVWGWHHHTTDGFFENVCTIPGDGENQVWFTVKRIINGQPVRFVERMTSRKRSFFVDCGLWVESQTPFSTVSVPHLEGKTVSMLVDGNVVLGKNVTNGVVTLDSPANYVIVGLPYVSKLQTQNVDFQTQSGTVQGQLKSVIATTIRAANSRGGKIGHTFNESDMIAIDWPVENVFGQAQALYTGDVKVTLYSNYNYEGRVCIKQDSPLPITIISLINEVEYGGDSSVR